MAGAWSARRRVSWLAMLLSMSCGGGSAGVSVRAEARAQAQKCAHTYLDAVADVSEAPVQLAGAVAAVVHGVHAEVVAADATAAVVLRRMRCRGAVEGCVSREMCLGMLIISNTDG